MKGALCLYQGCFAVGATVPQAMYKDGIVRAIGLSRRTTARLAPMGSSKQGYGLLPQACVLWWCSVRPCHCLLPSRLHMIKSSTCNVFLPPGVCTVVVFCEAMALLEASAGELVSAAVALGQVGLPSCISASLPAAACAAGLPRAKGPFTTYSVGLCWGRYRLVVAISPFIDTPNGESRTHGMSGGPRIRRYTGQKLDRVRLILHATLHSIPFL